MASSRCVSLLCVLDPSLPSRPPLTLQDRGATQRRLAFYGLDASKEIETLQVRGNRALAGAVKDERLPFDFFEKPAIIRLLQVLSPHFKAHKRKTVRNNVRSRSLCTRCSLLTLTTLRS